MKELGIYQLNSPILWCDNLGATFLTTNPMFHARTKHIDVYFHFVRKLVAQKALDVRFISSKDQVTDIFTKALSKSLFKYKLSQSPPDQTRLWLRGTVKSVVTNCCNPLGRVVHAVGLVTMVCAPCASCALLPHRSSDPRIDQCKPQSVQRGGWGDNC